MRSNKQLIFVSITSSLVTAILVLIGCFLLLNSGVVSLSAFEAVDEGSKKTVITGTAVEESQVIKTVEEVTPAVVSVVITKNLSTTQQYNQGYTPFGNLFGLPPQDEEGSTEQEVGQGSGFFVSSDGYIVTNKHVVDDKDAHYTVLTSEGKKYEAKVLAKDSTFDVAVLKVDGDNFAHLSFADSDTIKVGQKTIAIGNALGEYQNSVSTGIVSGLSRSITASTSTGAQEQLEGVVQTDAAINPGNSGGPLLDIHGNVIGVNVAMQSGAENVGFALPSNMVKGIVDSVRKHGKIVKPYLGIRYMPVTDALAETNNLPVRYGVLIVKGSSANELAVVPGSPADKAGIVENDILLEIDGVKLEKNKSLASVIREKTVDQTITIKLLHRGETKEVKVQLEQAP
jgi:serine protease Do